MTAVVASRRTGWAEDGLCAVNPTKAVTDLFFSDDPTEQARAKLICRRCPVVEQCLAWALATHQDHGTWGGLTEGEREALRRAQQAGAGRWDQ